MKCILLVVRKVQRKPVPTCEIYFSKKKEKDGLHQYIATPYDSVTTFGHPSISEDGKITLFCFGYERWIRRKRYLDGKKN